MKTLLINGSPRKDGNTAVALNEIAKALETEGATVSRDGFFAVHSDCATVVRVFLPAATVRRVQARRTGE